MATAIDVLAVMDDARDVLTALGSPGTANGVAEARAAVAEYIRDAERYRWIVEATEIPEDVEAAIFLSSKEMTDAAIDAARGERGAE